MPKIPVQTPSLPFIENTNSSSGSYPLIISNTSSSKISSTLSSSAVRYYAEGEQYTTSDINGFIHRQIRMTVSQSEPKENGKVYNNIDSFLHAKSNYRPLTLIRLRKMKQ